MHSWIAETFGLADGLARGLAFAVALGIVLILIALFVSILRRLTGTRFSTARSRQPRITVMDATNIDTRRRLLLIRRDNVEHLILVGGPSDIVVEQGIIKGAPRYADPPRDAIHTPPPAMNPPVFANTANPQGAAISSPRDGRDPANSSAPSPAPADEIRSDAAGQAEAAAPNPARSLLKAAMSGNGNTPSTQDSQTDKPSTARSTLAGLRRTPSKPTVFEATGGSARQSFAPKGPSAQDPGKTVEPVKPDFPTRIPASGSASDKSTRSLSASLAASRPSAVASHQVTPPSSGPAARAKTALFSSPTSDKKLRPGPAGEQNDPGQPSAATIATGHQPSSRQLPSVKTEDAQTAATHIQEAAFPGKSKDKPAHTHSDRQNGPLAVSPDGTATASAFPASPAADQTSTIAAQAAEEETGGQAKAAMDRIQAAKDKTTDPVPTQKPAATLPTAAPDAQHAEKHGKAEKASSLNSLPNADPTKMPVSKLGTSSETRKPDPASSQPTAVPNPIEDEMAKLLEEISGQHKQ